MPRPAIDYSRVAELYDAYVQVTFDIPFFLQEARKTAGDVLELMAGTGRVSAPLVEAGVRLTCVDASGEMLARLRAKLAQRGLAADVHQMDVRELDLGKRFDLIYIPFHSFAELLTPTDQRQALEKIQAHLADSGRFICTLHNPIVRTREITGQLGLIGKFPLPDGSGTLLLWGIGRYDSATHLAEGMQIYEEYALDGVMRSRRIVDTRFVLMSKSEFEGLAAAAGYRVVALYGDYSYSEFDEQTSRFMIFVLAKAV